MFYKTARAIFRFVFIILGLKVEGHENIPREGPLILASNHVSNWDPVMVALAVNRPVHFMAKAELFNYNILGKLLIKLHAFPVRRGSGDRQAIRHALRVLEQGHVLGIFPEGARNREDQNITAQSGTAMIALRSKVNVVPVACIGTGRIIPVGWLRPLVVRIGEPISLDEYRDQKVNSSNLEKLNTEIEDKIIRLLY
ncbi:1-acyl-sn-glycerol-3-phosphate acyltransferase [Syntrophomonas zehnderi OL-4]|uniref:1-acyl-sn-glycerol-3-phosphate acyltransferase n=1 Tax=Syntrophomonas zehnderi OL-4 TaxID=690567 RepID=A0A0E4C833_9FIRM|nr:lysophospholipid acyltransferase family protein [Syntrophomonas zehnderi]CFX21567.1 1-acyl-sn-glycerol-3-phosphate acyltransferase [Syntrophomonas zehnderi OL-4]